MGNISYLLRTYWLMVPDTVYFVILFSGVALFFVSAGIIFYGIARKKEKAFLKHWFAVVIVSVLMIVLTATGKIAPYCSFGG